MLVLILTTEATYGEFPEPGAVVLPDPAIFSRGNTFRGAAELHSTNAHYYVSMKIIQRCPDGRYGYLCQTLCPCAANWPCSVEFGVCVPHPTPNAIKPENGWLFLLLGLAAVCCFCAVIMGVFGVMVKILKKKRAHRSRHHDSPSTEDESKEHRSKKHKKHKRKRRDPTVSEETGGTTEDIA
ncbi:unnamed protein product, partial [Mesorhabditis spiculigera]